MREVDVREPEARPVTPLGIVELKLRQLRKLAEERSLSDNQFKQELLAVCNLVSGLEPYIEACTTPESPMLASLSRHTRSERWAVRHASGDTALELEQEMLSGHLEGQFLKMLVRATSAKRVLEIGLFTGYSALAMAEGLPPDGSLIACEIDPFAAAFAKGFFEKSPHGRSIRVEVGPASQTLDRLADAGQTFDFVFIDADKAGYLGYLDQLLERDLIAPNALICVDNTLMQGQPYGGTPMTPNGLAIAEFNRALSNDTRVEQVLLPIRDGVTLIRRASRGHLGVDAT